MASKPTRVDASTFHRMGRREAAEASNCSKRQRPASPGRRGSHARRRRPAQPRCPSHRSSRPGSSLTTVGRKVMGDLPGGLISTSRRSPTCSRPLTRANGFHSGHLSKCDEDRPHPRGRRADADLGVDGPHAGARPPPRSPRRRRCTARPRPWSPCSPCRRRRGYPSAARAAPS